MAPKQWMERQEVPPLGEGAVHVWLFSLEGLPAAVAAHADSLPAAERARADCYRYRSDRVHYIQSRWLLRQLISQYVAVPAAALHFLVGRYGKPYLENPLARISFNLSHSHGLGLFAFARTGRLGVDLEWLNPEAVTESLIRSVFSPAEQQVLFAQSPAVRIQGFYRGWTQKEAYLKGRGEGLNIPPQTISVRLHPAEPAGLLAVAGDMQESARWSLLDLPPVPGFAAALATEGADWSISCFTAIWQ